ncbi:cholecystokinin receptor-like [Asterias rubens]|uniref:Gastrin/cholecystokinin type B receptor n=1 Tax=Asterias rubens TaxID=7604 RepID=A0A8F2ZGB9_ASTRU|nr:cholecystokinin receptor-like [Asterias rubens]QWY12691.1 cholecystokinin-type receptor [Asterias rubens]
MATATTAYPYSLIDSSLPPVNSTFLVTSIVDVNSTNSSLITEDFDDDRNRGVRIGFGLNIYLTATLYGIVFVLAIVGNILVLVTLAQDKRMRTVTNMFLLSLAFSDLLFGIFCMPFTVVGNMLGRFVFGAVICKIVPYIQGISVTVSVWTMVVISLERYHAICNPLSSRVWQTKAHAYKAIVGVWMVALFLNLPAVIFSKLFSFNSGTVFRCDEIWPATLYRTIYRMCLFVILMVAPLFTMLTAYGLIIRELRRGMKLEQCGADNEKRENGIAMKNMGDEASCSLNEKKTKKSDKKPAQATMRSTSTSGAKKRVVKMLIVIVALFFVCWTPSWVGNIWIMISEKSASEHFGRAEVTIFKLMTYASACVNPIVYCFMNKRFRQGFLNAFSCGRRGRAGDRATASGDVSRFQSTRRTNVPRPSPTNYTNVSSDSSV